MPKDPADRRPLKVSVLALGKPGSSEIVLPEPDDDGDWKASQEALVQVGVNMKIDAAGFAADFADRLAEVLIPFGGSDAVSEVSIGFEDEEREIALAVRLQEDGFRILSMLGHEWPNMLTLDADARKVAYRQFRKRVNEQFAEEFLVIY